MEIEKTFHKTSDGVTEAYHLAGVMTSSSDIVYYKMQETLATFLETIGVDKYSFDTGERFKHLIPPFAHKGRTATIMIRGQIL
jgi:phenylalanyl-tRNA synthetase beta subunit